MSIELMLNMAKFLYGDAIVVLFWFTVYEDTYGILL